MDPFSVTAGIAGLLSLSIQLHQLITNHIESVKIAPEEALALATKLTAVISVLQQLERFIEAQGGSGHFTDTSIIYGTTKRCKDSLNSLDSTLSKFLSVTSRDSSTWRRFVKWPLTKEKHRQTVDLLDSYINIFQLSLNISGW